MKLTRNLIYFVRICAYVCHSEGKISKKRYFLMSFNIYRKYNRCFLKIQIYRP